MMILETRDVVKRFAGHTALNKVSIEIPEQSIFGMLGPNGAGKTTLIRIINQITAPDEGEVLFKGNRLSPDQNKLIGYLPEERGLYKKMSVGEQALYLVQLKGLSKHDALKKLKYWFEKFEIQAWWNKKVEELSKGMAQKVQFIITVLHEPELLIFDEPFSGFDPINVNILKDEILELRRNGATVIFSTHNMASVEELCDNIALINKSEKILDGKVSDIKRSFSTNTFEIGYSVHGQESLQSLLDGNFEVHQLPDDHGLNFAQVKLPAGMLPNDLIRKIMPSVNVYALNEVIPSMNDIFITAVNGVNNSKNHNNLKITDNE